MKIMTVIGTRPEGIKMAPVIKLLAQDPALKSVVVTTGQHREMLQTVFEVFDFKPDLMAIPVRPWRPALVRFIIRFQLVMWKLVCVPGTSIRHIQKK